MLHQILLGLFKYARDVFFNTLGHKTTPKPALYDTFMGLAQWYGEVLSRQSERNFPRLRFASGLMVANMNAKDFPGILLLMACVLQSKKGKELIAQDNAKFAEDGMLEDWQMLLETLLQFEMWMKKDSMRKDLVVRCKKKFRYLMALYRKVVNRTEGMGLKFVKFHALMHVPQEILDYGVPLEADTGANESAHKSEKRAARATQRRKVNFEEQTQRRLFEYDLLELAELELDGRAPWDYYEERTIQPELEEEEDEQMIGGEAYFAFYNEEEDMCYPVPVSKKSNDKDVSYDGLLIRFLCTLNGKLYDYITDPKKILPMYSLHKRNKVIFRSTMCLHGEVWRDWALINFGPNCKLPCHIHGFLDLKFLPGKIRVDVGTVKYLEPGYYAIVEYGHYIESDDRYYPSEIFKPIAKELEPGDDGTDDRRYYLIDVDTIEDTIAVVPANYSYHGWELRIKQQQRKRIAHKKSDLF